MVLQGEGEYTFHFNAADELSASQQHFARTQFDLFKAWYANWEGAQG
jgi:4-hydroxy-tetrahydrodipicolinate synthase